MNEHRANQGNPAAWLAGGLEAATDYAASAIADRHGSGAVAAKIQAHVIMAVV